MAKSGGIHMNEKQKEMKELYDKLPPTGKSVANGALLGAVAGSVVPIVGTSVGAIIGGVAGLALRIRSKMKE